MSETDLRNTVEQTQSHNENNADDDPGAVIVDEASGAVFEIEAECSDRCTVHVWDGGKAWQIARGYFNSQLRSGNFKVRSADEFELRPPRR